METAGKINVFDNSILLSLTVHVIGNSAKGEIEQVETSADKSMLKLSKQLLDCEEYKQLTDAATAIRNAVKRKCLGGQSESYTDMEGNKRSVGAGLQGLIKSGCYLVPLEMVSTIDDILNSMVPAFKVAVKKLCEVYEEKVKESIARLRDQANNRDYKSISEVKKACYIDYKWLSVGVPESLKNVRAELFEKEKAKAQAQWAEAGEEIRMVLRVGAKNLLDHMTERLTPGSDGKKKKFHDTMIERMKEFLTDFPGKNIMQDEELSVLVDRMKKAMQGTDVEDLRKSDAIRSTLLKSLSKVKTELDSMIEKVPIRKITLED